MGILAVVGWLRWKPRCGQLPPIAGRIAAPQLGPEMAEIECRIEGTVGIGQHRRDRVAEKLHVDDLPDAMAAGQLEETLAGSDMEPICHPFLRQPPDNAWKT